MIKRLIACLTICLIITGLICPVFSNASALPQPNWNDPGISEIINISDLTGWMLNGGTYDVSTYTDAESFMNDYYYGRTSTQLVDGNDLYYNQFGIGQDLYNIGAKNFSNRLDTNRMMASSFREHSGYGRRFSEQANEALLNTGNLYDMKIPLLNEVEFANFVGYNHDALRLYSEFFNKDSDPIPSFPEKYATYIDTINGSGFTNFLNSKYQMPSSDGTTTPLRLNDITWINYLNFLNPNPYNEIYLNPSQVCCSEISNVYITGSDNNYNISTTFNLINNFRNGLNWNDLYNFGNANWTRNKPSYQVAYYNSNGAVLNNSITYSYNGSLDNVFRCLSNTFHNINIYVNGDPWSIVGNSSLPTITPEFPDAVSGEELPTTTWPISRPRAPYYTSVPGILKAIEDAIKGDGKLDIDDLKPYLTDENGDPIPDPIFDPEPVPIPVPDPVNPDVVPGLPEIPAIPLDMPGYNGVSVLAEIINFTNQSLPTSLIVTFWGIVFGIVILGLIKILHK